MSAFYSIAGTSGDKESLAFLLERIVLTAMPDEIASGRWSGWQRAVRSSGRIGITAVECEVFAGKDLTDLEELRAARTPADLITGDQ